MSIFNSGIPAAFYFPLAGPITPKGPVTHKGPDTAPPFMPPPIPLPPGFPQPPPGVPGGVQLVPTRVWSEYIPRGGGGGRPYYYNKVTKQSVWEKPKDFELIMPLPVNFGMMPIPAATSLPAGGMNTSLPSSSASLGPPAQNSSSSSGGSVPTHMVAATPTTIQGQSSGESG